MFDYEIEYEYFSAVGSDKYVLSADSLEDAENKHYQNGDHHAVITNISKIN